MKNIFTVLAFAALSFTATSYTNAALATEPSGNDDFGGAYFTAATPDALSEGDDMFSAEALSNIEPAAGGDAGFIMPEDAADQATGAVDSDRLPVPDEVIVPGME